MFLCLFVFLSLALHAARVQADITPAAQLVQLYGLATSTSFAFPSQTLSASDANAHIVSGWSLARGRIQDGPDDVAFVADPFPGTRIPTEDPRTPANNGTVLQVTYPNGSFSHDTGGVQFYNLWNTSDGSPFETAMLSYEVAFDEGFDWVKGGKLPGLRGGFAGGCSGGESSTGEECFSTRLMWRKNGNGEVYAYIPSPNGLCDESGVTCNDDFGISLSRGAFSFVSGQWNRVTLLVQMNNPVDVANGNLQLYFNDLEAISHRNLQIRSNTNLSINGMYFSTFFGGSDESWATPNTTHTYYRNMTLWGGFNPSNLTGAQVENSAKSSMRSGLPTAVVAGLLGLFCGTFSSNLL